MESVGSSLKQMRENVCAVQEAAVPGLTSWGQDSLDQCQARWDVLSKQVRRAGKDLCISVKLVYTFLRVFFRQCLFHEHSIHFDELVFSVGMQ